MIRLLTGDCRAILPTLADESVHMVATSPPFFGLRDYGVAGQIGLEPTIEEHIEALVGVFRECRRVLRKDGTLWIEYGDSYAGTNGVTFGGSDFSQWQGGQTLNDRDPRNKRPTGLKAKDLIGAPWQLAFALRADGWYLRDCIIWAKPNPMPESVRDRCTKSHEYIFLMSKSPRYYFDQEAIAEPVEWPETKARVQFSPRRAGAAGREPSGNEAGKEYLRPATRNRRSVWTIATQPFSGSKYVADYVGADGKSYKRSADCPVHGLSGHRRTQQTVANGEQPSRLSHCNPDSETYLDAGRVASPGSIPSMTNCKTDEEMSLAHVLESNGENRMRDQLRKPFFDGRGDDAEFPYRSDGRLTESTPLADGQGFGLPDSSQTAIEHSNESRKTGRALETNPSCSASAQIASSTDGTSTLLGLLDSDAHTPANNRDGAGLGERPSVQKASRSGRKTSSRHSKCTCTPISTDHFATWPTALVEPMIKAGTSEKGCCAKCGAPWVRLTERAVEYRSGSGRAGNLPTGKGRNGDGQIRENHDIRMGNTPVVTTVGWSASCACAAEVVLCTVLDPFAGSGTTGLVADRLGRNAVLIDLNGDYAEMARERLIADAPLFVRLEEEIV